MMLIVIHIPKHALINVTGDKIELVDQDSEAKEEDAAKEEDVQVVLDMDVKEDGVEKICDVEEELRKTLARMEIQGIAWSDTDTDSGSQVMFPVEKEDEILRELAMIGIGSIFGEVHVLPLELTIPELSKGDVESDKEEGRGLMEKTSLVEASRLIRSQHNEAQLTPDRLILVLVASLLAGFGLAANNVVVIVASMLVSPLMGPILALTVGFYVKDNELAKKASKSVIIMLLMCILVGMWISHPKICRVGVVFGAIGALVDAQDVWGWPVIEMSSRGTASGLLVGVGVAVPSGVGVAVSALKGNINSLVGVAISASLLPPLVNAGLLWVFAFRRAGSGFSDDVAVMGTYSCLLGLVNIVCIFFSAIFMFWAKQMTGSLRDEEDRFVEQMRIARGYNLTVRGKEAEKYHDVLNALQEINPSWDTHRQARALSKIEKEEEPPPPKSPPRSLRNLFQRGRSSEKKETLPPLSLVGLFEQPEPVPAPKSKTARELEIRVRVLGHESTQVVRPVHDQRARHPQPWFPPK